ncbi:hypothetical protein MMC31_004893 [Peltigera leucophlebia]|nr:hypothetical protein [Peltigera leucophlebia]
MPYSKQVPLIWLHDNLWDPINSEPEKKDEILERVKSDLSAYEAEDYVLTADDIGVHVALDMFGLRRAFEWDAWKLKDEQLFDVPDLLSEALLEIDIAVYLG